MKKSLLLTAIVVLLAYEVTAQTPRRVGGWWAEFYKRYPGSGGFIILSRVGFNPATSQALVAAG